MTAEIRFPLFTAEVDPDIRFFGFDLTSSRRRAPTTRARRTTTGAGTSSSRSFPGEPRFGMDIEFDPDDDNDDTDHLERSRAGTASPPGASSIRPLRRCPAFFNLLVGTAQGAVGPPLRRHGVDPVPAPGDDRGPRPRDAGEAPCLSRARSSTQLRTARAAHADRAARRRRRGSEHARAAAREDGGSRRRRRARRSGDRGEAAEMPRGAARLAGRRAIVRKTVAGLVDGLHDGIARDADGIWSAETPILLLPLRVETRFKGVRAPRPRVPGRDLDRHARRDPDLGRRRRGGGVLAQRSAAAATETARKEAWRKLVEASQAPRAGLRRSGARSRPTGPISRPSASAA